MTNRKEYAAVDVFKMVCAILVMLIHTKPFENNFWLDAGVGMITRFAVPYFFATSGYFLFSKLKMNSAGKDKIIRAYFARLLVFYAIWFVIIRCVDYLTGAPYKGIAYYIKQFFFTTDGSILWFINGLLWGTLITFFLNCIFSKRITFVISVFSLLIGYSVSTLRTVTTGWGVTDLLSPLIGIIGIQNGLFFGFPYIALGALLTETEVKDDIKKDLLMTIVFFFCLGAESLIAVLKLHAPLTFLWLSALPMTWFVLRLTLSIEINSKPIYYKIRKISTLFYVLHAVVIRVLHYQFALSGFDEIDTMNLLLTGATFAITMLLSLLVLYLSKKQQLRWLNYAM